MTASCLQNDNIFSLQKERKCIMNLGKNIKHLQGGSNARLCLWRITNFSPDLYPTSSMDCLLRNCSRFYRRRSDRWRLFILSFLAPPSTWLFGFTPSVSFLCLDPDRSTSVLGSLCLGSESNHHRGWTCRLAR